MTSLSVIAKVLFILPALFLVMLFLPRRGRRGKKQGAWRPFDSWSMQKTACLIFIILFYLYFRGIEDHGFLDPIEGTNASVALNMAMGNNLAVPLADGRPYVGNSMGFWWLSALSLSKIGWRELSVRLWPVLGGLGMAAAGWFIALRTGGARAANYAAVLTGSSFLVYVTSQLASPHTLYAFCVAMSLLGGLYAFRDRRYFALLHASAALAFVVYGPAGIVLPWLSILAYAVLTGQERFLAGAIFYWPGLLATALIGGGYVTFLKIKNPYILTLMLHGIPSEAFNSVPSALIFLAAGFFPWIGVLPGAIRSAFPLNRGFVLPSERQNVFLLAWSAVFIFFGAFSGDALLLVASIPALAVLCANHLAQAVEKEDFHLFQKVVAMEIVLLVPLLCIGLPWFFAVCGQAVRHTVMSVIPWAVFHVIFLLAGWRCARKRQVRKLMLHMSVFSLMALLPFAGVFDLLGESFSVRDPGLYIREKSKQDDIVIQYAMNHPSLYFYVGKPGQTSILTRVPANQRIFGQSAVSDDEVDKIWRGERRVFMLLDRSQKIENHLPQIVDTSYETRYKMILSNRDSGETAQGSL